MNLKSFVTCCLLVKTFFLFDSPFKFFHRSKITLESLFQAGLTRRRTFRLVTHSSLTIVCVGEMPYLGRKEKQRHQEKEKKNITDFP